METIRKDRCIEVGYVQKTHGIDGELTLNISDGLIDSFEELEVLFLDIDSLLVPFFPTNIRIRSQKTVTIAFEDLENVEKADQFVGVKVFINRDEAVVDDERFQPEMITGFKVIDIERGELGVIVNVSDYSGNVLLDIETRDGQEVMLPLSEEFMKGFDEDQKIITVECPDGLLDLF